MTKLQEGIEPLADLLARDLDHIVDQLVDEFAAMAGKRLLITGGAGFLGYYLVQSVLHWNDRVVEDQRIHDDRVRQLRAWCPAVAG